ncbi:MAG: hypothetical protein AAF498_04665 [Pseudomonadota bacterium]
MKNSNQTRRINRDTIEHQRLASRNGRLQRTLAATIFSDRYISLVMSNPEDLLRMPYLCREFGATKRVLKALKKRLHVPGCKALYDKINLIDGDSEPSSPLCAIARHLRARAMLLDLDSLFFADCIGEWTMETTVHGIAQWLDELPDVVKAANASFEHIQKEMQRIGAGYVEVGAFEPDLRSVEEYNDRAALQRLCEELGWTFPETGGYVVCSHRLVRVQSDRFYQSLLDEMFPGYRRVVRKQIDRDKTIEENLTDILAYIWKLEEMVDGADGDADINEGDCRRCIRSAILGTTADGLSGRKREDALCAFALFFDDLGMEFFKINHVNIHARAWFGKDEREMIQKEGMEFADLPGTQKALHGHCNDAPRRRLLQETPAYRKMTLAQKTSLTMAQFQMRKLGTSYEIGPLIPPGQKMSFSDGTEGIRMPVVGYGSRYHYGKTERSPPPKPMAKRVVPQWEKDILRDYWLKKT